MLLAATKRSPPLDSGATNGCFIVDNFGIEYVGEHHAHHLRDFLKEHYTITEDRSGTKFVVIGMDWDYQQQACHLSMKDYNRKLLLQYIYPVPTKRRLSPHLHVEINYGAKSQYATELA